MTCPFLLSPESLGKDDAQLEELDNRINDVIRALQNRDGYYQDLAKEERNWKNNSNDVLNNLIVGMSFARPASKRMDDRAVALAVLDGWGNGQVTLWWGVNEAYDENGNPTDRKLAEIPSPSPAATERAKLNLRLEGAADFLRSIGIPP